MSIDQLYDHILSSSLMNEANAHAYKVLNLNGGVPKDEDDDEHLDAISNEINKFVLKQLLKVIIEKL